MNFKKGLSQAEPLEQSLKRMLKEMEQRIHASIEAAALELRKNIVSDLKKVSSENTIPVIFLKVIVNKKL